MKKLDCIYVERLSGERNTIKLKKQTVGEMKIGTMKQFVKESSLMAESGFGKKKSCKHRKADVRLLRRMKRVCNQNTVILAKQQILYNYSVDNVLFDLRKRELLENVKGITQYLQREIGMDGRKSVLLFIQSEQWRLTEIRDILLEAKKYYEDIFIVNRSAQLELGKLVEYFFEEYGVVLHLLQSEQYLKQSIDTVFFLVQEWKDEYQRFTCKNGYMIAELEGNMKRKRKRIHRDCDKLDVKYNATRKKEIYMGFVYTYQGKPILYELAIAMVYHDTLKQLHQTTHGENAISIVAIYSLG